MKFILTFTLSILFFSFTSFSQECIKENEKLVFSFTTHSGKKLVLAKEKSLDYLVYRFGKEGKIEMEYPDKLKNSWSQFRFTDYMRGGPNNEGMDINYLYFTHQGYRYMVYTEYYSKVGNTKCGVKVENLKTGETTIIKGNPKTRKGSLTYFRDMEKVEKTENVFKLMKKGENH